MEAISEEKMERVESEPNGSGELTQRQEAAIQAVIAHPTLKGAAQAAGISYETLWRYMQNKGFKRRLGEAREASIAHASVQLQGAAGDAVKISRELMCKEDAPAASRVSAARAVLELSYRARVIEELQAEVERLKEIVGDGQDEGDDGEGA